MFSAYKIGVTVALTNQVSSILGMIGRDFAKTDVEAKRLQATLKEIKLLGASGLLLGGFGFAGLDLVSKLVKPANEYQHQLALMNAAGMTQVEIAKSIGAAWQTTSTVMTSTATQNLAAVRELRMVFRGDTGEAIANMPTVQKLQAVLQSVKGEGAHDEAYTVAKALELKGAVKDPAQFTTQADMMTKAIIASGGKVGATDFLSAFKYGRTATTGWSDEFAYTILPTLIQEMKSKGGSGGVGGPGNALMSVFAAVVGGTVSQKALKLWEQIGLLDPSKEVFTKTGSLKGIRPGGIRGADDFQSNPFDWVQKFLVPALQKHGYGDEKAMREAIQYLFPARTAGFMITQLAMQPWKFTGDQKIINQAQGLGGFNTLIHQDPNMAYMALAAQWDNLKTAFGISVVPILIPMIGKLTGALNDFARWAQRNPALVDGLVYSFTLLSGSLLFSGTVLTLMAAFKSLSLIFTLGGLAPGVLTALGGNLGLAAAGFLRMAGPLAIIAGILAAFKPDDATAQARIKQGMEHPFGAPDPNGGFLNNLWKGLWHTGGGNPDGSSGIGGKTFDVPSGREHGDIATWIADGVKAALHGIEVVVDGKAIGQIAIDQGAASLNGPRRDTNRFDGTLSYSAP
jgi:hypothetical protein